MSAPSTWRVPALLLLLSAVPAVGGVVRLLSLSSGVVASGDERFLAHPVPTAIHVVAATLYALLGAFQFSAGVRRRWPRWHRFAGRFVAVCGLATSLTGLWMAPFNGIPQEMQGSMLLVTRLVVGVAMTASIVLGVAAILRRDVATHEAWMVRAYALGQGAGMQAVLMLPATILSGPVLGPTRDVFMALAWLINAVVAEWILRARAAPAVRPAPAG